ncbi:MAG: methyltransferase domain-containing protein [Ardenticatenia bacterium]|nr:methyltransferase domain-containing protein [Ardenticatenia bacterium]
MSALGRRVTDGPKAEQTCGEGEALRFACPACRAPLELTGPGEARCPADGHVYTRVDGIWRFLLPEREAFFRQFVQEYETVRRAEGRGADTPAYYRALPFHDLTGRYQEDWHIRAQSFLALLEHVVKPLESTRQRPMAVLDLGAGNGWLAYRLARRNHTVAAVDLLTNAFDGLGAHVHYDVTFTPVQAEFDRLPFTEELADLVVFNGSFHYAIHYETTLREALRVLRTGGRLVIMDSPVYRDGRSGDQMVREREALFEAKYGFPSNALASENYLTFDRLAELSDRVGVHWEFVRPRYSFGWRWTLRRWRTRLVGRREPAQFLLIVGRKERVAGT